MADQQTFDDEARRREKVIREGRTNRTASPAEDRRRALSRWVAGWREWYDSAQLREAHADAYQALYAGIHQHPTLDALIEAYWARHRDADPPPPWLNAAHYNAGKHIERRNAGLIPPAAP
ncbi:hypothetical protein HN371_29255 [Candidatus Poribacteria bacterium]|jgi:hypothetical protein|nr:hypothetical protein [Candidatus Poribacteria bacterium]MBT5533498.1 hypothetical protein [Candidatus Poribacteria bacterium]MBT5710132.1 hypothetical protein [Candidatus Poribacteria bacterium]MBT7100537.1 hypothetical protein [Candidatus Poribacteria bacterium]MBT7808895.1 hypothetical protein [Candidatus Poribacteria bacterium]